ncbi:hypothetical protein CC1G_06938 [Coprinopsis cinerea okayama7|uniref:Zn(2)-C6 fungal-type domain-containing protein n=1 Tax=Coprinopsis cinerea (strain Okayama-7 / 130 / ATCC MYA-4618 / FGSC 9003) TaxID=240176 RepID=A8NZR7_COPC7|nr:hypothetical protein CC1G_06938 [Coprinopsis cinerea okayama7\|eukprot:XP_001837732.1 hypothetical protein CC1G_06938 [Coprinopsis cinerea okayama7\
MEGIQGSSNSNSQSTGSSGAIKPEPSGSKATGSGGGQVERDSKSGGKEGPQIRSRITVVCGECKRLKLKCDRNSPCSSCVKRDTVPRCIYSQQATEKVDLHSINNRLMALEMALVRISHGLPPQYIPKHPPVVEEAKSMGLMTDSARHHGGGAMNFSASSSTADYQQDEPPDPPLFTMDPFPATPHPQARLQTTAPPHDPSHTHHHHLAAPPSKSSFLDPSAALVLREIVCGLREELQLGGELSTDSATNLYLKSEPDASSSTDDIVMHSSGSSGTMEHLGSNPLTASSSPKPAAIAEGTVSQQQKYEARLLLPPLSIYYPHAPVAVPGTSASSSLPFPAVPQATFTPAPWGGYTGGSGDVVEQDLTGHGTLNDERGSPWRPGPSMSPHLSMRAPESLNPSTHSPAPIPKPAITPALRELLPNTLTCERLIESAKDSMAVRPIELGLPSRMNNKHKVAGFDVFAWRSKKVYARASTTAGKSRKGRDSVSSSSSSRVAVDRLVSAMPGEPRRSSYSSGSSRRGGDDDMGEGVGRGHDRSGSRYHFPIAPAPRASTPARSEPSSSSRKPRSTAAGVIGDSLAFFGLMCAVMAVGASRNGQSLEDSAGSGSPNATPAFLSALSLQALEVWMDNSENAELEERVEYIRACLVHITYLLGNGSLPLSTSSFSSASRSNQDAIHAVLGRMINAMQAWGHESGIFSPTEVANIEGRGVSRTHAQLIAAEIEESRKRVWWEALYYTLMISDALGKPCLAPAQFFTVPQPTLDLQLLDGGVKDEVGRDGHPRGEEAERNAEQATRMRAERLFSASRARLVHLAHQVKSRINTPNCCCGYTVDQAALLMGEIQGWMKTIPQELLYAFEMGVYGSSSRLMGFGKHFDVHNDDNRRAVAGSNRWLQQLMSCELALFVQALIVKIHAPFIPLLSNPNPQNIKQLKHVLQEFVSASQATIRVSRLLKNLLRDRVVPLSDNAILPVALDIYAFDQLILDATVVCSRVCLGPSWTGVACLAELLGLTGRDQASIELMQSIKIGLDILDALYGSGEDTERRRRRDNLKIVASLRRLWKKRSIVLSDRSAMLKRKRDTADGDNVPRRSPRSSPMSSRQYHDDDDDADDSMDEGPFGFDPNPDNRGPAPSSGSPGQRRSDTRSSPRGSNRSSAPSYTQRTMPSSGSTTLTNFAKDPKPLPNAISYRQRGVSEKRKGKTSGNALLRVRHGPDGKLIQGDTISTTAPTPAPPLRRVAPTRPPSEDQTASTHEPVETPTAATTASSPSDPPPQDLLANVPNGPGNEPYQRSRAESFSDSQNVADPPAPVMGSLSGPSRLVPPEHLQGLASHQGDLNYHPSASDMNAGFNSLSSSEPPTPFSASMPSQQYAYNGFGFHSGPATTTPGTSAALDGGSHDPSLQPQQLSYQPQSTAASFITTPNLDNSAGGYFPAQTVQQPSNTQIYPHVQTFNQGLDLGKPSQNPTVAYQATGYTNSFEGMGQWSMEQHTGAVMPDQSRQQEQQPWNTNLTGWSPQG